MWGPRVAYGKAFFSGSPPGGSLDHAEVARMRSTTIVEATLLVRYNGSCALVLGQLVNNAVAEGWANRGK